MENLAKMKTVLEIQRIKWAKVQKWESTGSVKLQTGRTF